MRIELDRDRHNNVYVKVNRVLIGNIPKWKNPVTFLENNKSSWNVLARIGIKRHNTIAIDM